VECFRPAIFDRWRTFNSPESPTDFYVPKDGSQLLSMGLRPEVWYASEFNHLMDYSAGRGALLQS
jgi:hypothetical protein